MSRRIRVRTSDPRAAQILDILLSNLPDTSSLDPLDFSLEGPGPNWQVRLPDGSCQSSASLLDAFYAVESFVYDYILPGEQSCLVVHGAALLHRRSGSVLLLAGPSHCGKSTLSLTLLSTGGFRYLSEEAVGIALNGRILSYPKPFRIRHGGERILAGQRGWKVPGATQSGIRYVVPPSHLIGSASCAGRLRCAIFPEFVAGSRCSSTPMTRADSIAWLATCSTNRPGFLAAHLGRLPDLWGETEAWRLRWSDPLEAAGHIRVRLEEALAGGADPKGARTRLSGGSA